MLLWPADWMESASDCWRLHWKFNIVELWKLQSATADDSHPPALATVASWSINTRTTVGVCRRAGRLLATEVFTQALRSCAVTISQNGGRRTRWIYIIADCVNTVPRSPSILCLERVMGPSDLHVAVTKHLYEWFSPSVCPSVRASVCHPSFTMFPSSYHHRDYQGWLPMTEVMSMEWSRSGVKGKCHRGLNPI